MTLASQEEIPSQKCRDTDRNGRRSWKWSSQVLPSKVGFKVETNQIHDGKGEKNKIQIKPSNAPFCLVCATDARLRRPSQLPT